MLQFSKLMQAHFNQMCQSSKIFRSQLSGQEVWDLYLNSFEVDPIFRDPNSSEHNCNLCNNFIRRYGNILAVNENLELVSLFDFEANDEFNQVAKAISKAIKSNVIGNVFFETFGELNSLNYEKCNKTNTLFRLGIDKNVKRYTKEEAELYRKSDGSFIVNPNEIRVFNHLHINIPSEYVDKSGNSIESIMANFRDAKTVFKRAMDEISLDTLILVRDLINQGSLLDGQTYLYKIEQIIPLKKEYDALSSNQKDTWCWVKSYKLPFAKFKNELIGVLCSELAEGKELNDACQSWNKRVDPANYMKATAPITKKQIEEAQIFVETNGYVESFDRRFATIDDIKVSEILHSNIGDGKLKQVSIFDGIKATSTQHKRSEFDGVEEVSIDKFMKDILPGCTSVEAFLTNNQSGNLVSLTTSNIEENKRIFKWSNNYSWTFNGNLAGKSMIKDAIKERGGKVEGCLNIRLHFPNTTSDYDLHVKEPNGGHIYYGQRNSKSSGSLDLDAQGQDGNFPPEKRVENIVYTDKSMMPKGVYQIYVNNYSTRDNGYGFNLEIEIDGEITSFNYDKAIPQKASILVCTFNYNGKDFELRPEITVSSSNSIAKEIYGLDTNKFHKVNLVCLSPNHWNEESIGNKHYFFMLDGCKCPTSIRSFHAENLIPELAQHRKVLEVLGNTTMIEPSDKQLSGLGFNATVRDELIVKLSGSHKRVIKIKF